MKFHIVCFARASAALNETHAQLPVMVISSIYISTIGVNGGLGTKRVQ
jgi:hypothetical protein